MDKRTLSRAASRVALGVTDFLGIKALPGTENYRATPSGRPESEIDSQNDDEPYWMKDDFWNDSVELQSGIPTHITLSHIQKVLQHTVQTEILLLHTTLTFLLPIQN